MQDKQEALERGPLFSEPGLFIKPAALCIHLPDQHQHQHQQFAFG